MYDEYFNYTSFIFHLQGIGESTQGFSNCMLYIIFSREMRSNFIRCIRCKGYRPISVLLINDDIANIEHGSPIPSSSFINGTRSAVDNRESHLRIKQMKKSH